VDNYGHKKIFQLTHNAQSRSANYQQEQLNQINRAFLGSDHPSHGMLFPGCLAFSMKRPVYKPPLFTQGCRLSSTYKEYFSNWIL
jgi:hypothetical protein